VGNQVPTELFQGVRIHARANCTPPCPFHAPSDHPLRDAPIHIRLDKAGLVERICPHGVGHDDPDSVAYMQAHGAKWAGVHGCDGCCTDDRHTTARSIGLINANVELFAEFLKGRMPDQADEINLSVALWQQGDDDV
jgi:hypothetical protein